MSQKKLGVAILGCGNIAGPYAENLSSYPEIELIGVADMVTERAEALAAQAGCRAYPSMEALLADEAVDLVVNLTIHHAHRETTARCLEAGKHVHSEKPLAMSYEDAQALVELARQKDLRLGCSPATFMGEAQQTAWKWIREGRLGPIRAAYAEVNWGRIEAWHPAPGPFYQTGVLFDVAVYPLTMLTTIFGPVRRVWAHGQVLYPNRVTSAGIPFQIETPDFVVAMLELEQGPLVRLTADFYVSRRSSRQDGIEFHGDVGSLHLGSWHEFDAPVAFAKFGEPLQPVSFVKEPYRGGRGGVEWGRPVLDLARAMAEGRPHRATGEQAAHVVEIVCAINQAITLSQPVAVHSSFTPPQPMEWAF